MKHFILLLFNSQFFFFVDIRRERMISGLEADLAEQRDLTHNLVIGMVGPHFSDSFCLS